MRAFVSLLLFLPLVAASEPASVIRETELKKSPATDAPTVAVLAEQAKVEALERKGGWVRVKAEAGEGWVKMLGLRYGGPPKAGGSGLAQLFNVARTGTSGTQVTTGVRGLEAESIATARPNAAELKKLERFAASKDAASRYAAAAHLQAQKVEYPKQ